MRVAVVGRPAGAPVGITCWTTAPAGPRIGIITFDASSIKVCPPALTSGKPSMVKVPTKDA